MKRASHEKPEATERLERFRVLLLEYRDIWHCAPDKQEFLNLWARSRESVIVVDTSPQRTIDP